MISPENYLIFGGLPRQGLSRDMAGQEGQREIRFLNRSTGGLDGGGGVYHKRDERELPMH